jgi:hypothetical protein
MKINILPTTLKKKLAKRFKTSQISYPTKSWDGKFCDENVQCANVLHKP